MYCTSGLNHLHDRNPTSGRTGRKQIIGVNSNRYDPVMLKRLYTIGTSKHGNWD